MELKETCECGGEIEQITNVITDITPLEYKEGTIIQCKKCKSIALAYGDRVQM